MQISRQGYYNAYGINNFVSNPASLYLQGCSLLMKIQTLRKHPTGNTARICDEAKMHGISKRPESFRDEIVSGVEGQELHLMAQVARLKIELRGPITIPADRPAGYRPITAMENLRDELKKQLGWV